MKMRFYHLAALILLAAGAQPASSAFWQWSKTAATNASADPTINWAEGMSPSSVNDSARAMMARAAEYRDDISGLLIAGGGPTAYTVTTNQGLSSAPSDGQLLSLRIGTVTNGSSPTLQVDGGTAYPISSFVSGVLTPIPAATLVAGNPYTFTYSLSNGAWEPHGFYANSLTVPLGGLIPYTLATVPNSNFVFPAGQCLSTTTYATYWVALGSPASGSCAGGQFRIIDLSGRVPAGLDTMPGFSAANRLTASGTGCGTAMTSVGATCANGAESQTLTALQLPIGIPASVSGSISVTSTNNLILSGGTADNYSSVGGFGTWNSPSRGAITSTGSASLSGTANGGGGAHPNVQPTIAVTYLLRVL